MKEEAVRVLAARGDYPDIRTLNLETVKFSRRWSLAPGFGWRACEKKGITQTAGTVRVEKFTVLVGISSLAYGMLWLGSHP